MWASCFLTCTFCTLIAVILLKRTDYVGITSLFQGHEIEFVCIDVFLPCDVSRSKKTAQLLSMILKSNSQRVGGTWELDHRVQKSILCTLCNKSWQSLCFNVTRKLISFLYTHLISYQPSLASLEPERGRKNVSIVSVINEIIFIPRTILTDVYSASKSI